MPGTYAILLSAGRGKRFGGAVPKQYRMLAGRPLLRHAAEALLRSEGLAGVAVAIRPEDRADYESAAAGLGLMPPVAGGAEPPLPANRPAKATTKLAIPVMKFLTESRPPT